MGKRALRRKLRSIRLTAFQKIIVALSLLAAGLVWVAEQLAGNAVANYAYKPVAQAMGQVFQWSADHPGQVSMAIFFLTASYLVRQIIHDTRTVKEFLVTVDNQMLTFGAILVENHTGDDLFNCTIDIAKVDGIIAKDRHLDWFENVGQQDIKNGRYAFFYQQDVGRSLAVGRDNGKLIYDEKVHEVEIFFRGNTLKNTTVSASIWMPVLVKHTGVSEVGEPIYRVFLSGQIEISPPDFGGES